MEQHSRDGRESKRENLARMERRLEASRIDVHRHEAEIRHYFANTKELRLKLA